MTFSTFPDGVVFSFNRGEMFQIKTVVFKGNRFAGYTNSMESTIALIGDHFTAITSDNNLKKLFALRNINGNGSLVMATESLLLEPQLSETYVNPMDDKETRDLTSQSTMRLSQFINYISKNEKFIEEFDGGER